MAQGLRSRAAALVTAAALGVSAAVVALAACSEEAPRSAPPPEPRRVDTTTIAADALVEAVLTECHAPLRGFMSRVAARVQLADGTEVQLFAELPDKLRVQSSSERYLLIGTDGVRLDEGGAAATPAASQWLQQLRTVLDAAAFGPLHRATACTRRGPSTFELVDAAGATTTLELRPDTLLPGSFRSAAGTVTIADYLRTETTWIARELELAGLGRCRVHFDSGRIDWAPDFFAIPAPATGSAPASNRPRMQAPGAGGEPQSPVPVLVDGKPLGWAMVRDPGDWPARVAAYVPLHTELTRQDQAIAGFPVFWQEDGARWLAAPFRQRPNGAAFAPPAGWQLRQHPAGRWLVVYPPTGDLVAKIAAGTRLLEDALRAQRLTAKGPITAQPFFHLQEGEPPAEKLLAPTVRMAVRVE